MMTVVHLVRLMVYLFLNLLVLSRLSATAFLVGWHVRVPSALLEVLHALFFCFLPFSPDSI